MFDSKQRSKRDKTLKYKYNLLGNNENDTYDDINETSFSSPKQKISKSYSKNLLNLHDPTDSNSDDDFHLPANSRSETESSIVKDLNNELLKRDDNFEEVLNPLYNIDEYSNKKKSTNYLKTKNSNNNNNKCNQPKKSCNHVNTKHERNSFLNVLTRTIRSLVTQNKDEVNTLKCSKMEERLMTSSSNYRIDDIDISLNRNNQIQLKLVIPQNCFNQNELSALEQKKFKNKSKTKNTMNSQNCPNESSSDDRNSFLQNFAHPNSYAHKKHTKRYCLLVLSLITIVFNPIFGFIALLAVLKSEKCRDETESRRLANTARQTSIAGIIISLILIALSTTLYFLHTKFFDMIKFNEIVFTKSNDSNSNNSDTSSFINLLNSHRLHYQITHLSTEQPESTSSQRFIRNNVSQLDQSLQSSPSTSPSSVLTKSNDALTINATTNPVKYYDRLSILIDHDLLEMLKLKYKINPKN